MDVHRVGRSKRSQRISQITKRRSSSSDSSSSNEPKKKSSKKKKKKKYRSCSSSSSSPIRKKKKRKRKHSSTSSSSSSERKRKKKEKKKKKKKKKKKERERMEKEKVSDRCSAQGTTITTTQLSSPQVLPQSSLQSPKKRSMVPMTKEEYDRQQSIMRRVYDPDTGRNRLVKGDGEILEEIVSYARHKEINKISTKQDGESFSASLGLWKK